MPRRISITDLARLLHLAPSTVSRALTGCTDVSEATRQRVRQLADELHYQPNQLAAALRSGHTRTLGVVVPHITGSFFSEVVDGISVAARQAGYQVLIGQSHDDAQQEKDTLAQLLHAQVAGLLVSLASTTHEFSHFEALRVAECPLVFFDRAAVEVAGPRISAVVIDDYAGAYAAVRHLIAEGCRRIAHFSGPLHIGIYQQRYQGYRAALHAHGLPYREELLHVSDLQPPTAAASMRQMLGLSSPPDAVFSAGDLATVGALQAIKAAALRVPEDVALAGFSNAEFSRLTEPPLTTVDQGSHLMGRAAVQLLLQILRTAAGGPPPPPLVLTPQLLVRASSRRRPAG